MNVVGLLLKNLKNAEGDDVEVLDFACRTDVPEGDNLVGYVLCAWRSRREWVTWCVGRRGECFSGRYCVTLEEARREFGLRVDSLRHASAKPLRSAEAKGAMRGVMPSGERYVLQAVYVGANDHGDVVLRIPFGLQGPLGERLKAAQALARTLGWSESAEG